MADIVVTVPKWFWFDWIAEGDAVGEPPTGEEWGFTCGWKRPPCGPDDRCYIVAHDRLRGYAPITSIEKGERGYAIGRKGGAVAITIPGRIVGFRGWQKVWWNREIERPFDNWRHADVAPEWYRKQAMTILDEFYEPAEAKLWMRAPQQLLNMAIPKEIIERGDGHKVLAVLDQMSEGVYG